MATTRLITKHPRRLPRRRARAMGTADPIRCRRDATAIPHQNCCQIGCAAYRRRGRGHADTSRLGRHASLGNLRRGARGKIKVHVRHSWTEPVNIFATVAMYSGERKSPVFGHVMQPVQEFEREEVRRMAPIIAEAASEHRMLEKKLERVERQAASPGPKDDIQKLRYEAKQLARELEAHSVPAMPVLSVDDISPPMLVKHMAAQGGRMLQAAPEGTLFEIAAGKHSNSEPDFDVYLKGHAGDAYRSDRISRNSDHINEALLSIAVAVQPDVIRGLTLTTRLCVRRAFPPDSCTRYRKAWSGKENRRNADAHRSGGGVQQTDD